MMVAGPVRHNQEIQTPNGPGIVEGIMYDTGHQYLLVRHVVSKMLGQGEGRDMTPKGKIQKLFMYEVTH